MKTIKNSTRIKSVSAQISMKNKMSIQKNRNANFGTWHAIFISIHFAFSEGIWHIAFASSRNVATVSAGSCLYKKWLIKVKLFPMSHEKLLLHLPTMTMFGRIILSRQFLLRKLGLKDHESMDVAAPGTERPFTILEVGCGTGKFTRVMVEVLKGKNVKVIASEPLQSMCEQFKVMVPDAEIIQCPAEKIRKQYCVLL